MPLVPPVRPGARMLGLICWQFVVPDQSLRLSTWLHLQSLRGKGLEFVFVVESLMTKKKKVLSFFSYLHVCHQTLPMS